VGPRRVRVNAVSPGLIETAAEGLIARLAETEETDMVAAREA